MKRADCELKKVALKATFTATKNHVCGDVMKQFENKVKSIKDGLTSKWNSLKDKVSSAIGGKPKPSQPPKTKSIPKPTSSIKPALISKPKVSVKVPKITKTVAKPKSASKPKVSVKVPKITKTMAKPKPKLSKFVKAAFSSAKSAVIGAEAAAANLAKVEVEGNAEQRAAAFAEERRKFAAAEKDMAASSNENLTPAQESQADEVAARSVVEAEAIAKAESSALVLARAEAEGNAQDRAAAFVEAQDAFKSAELVRSVTEGAATSQVESARSTPSAPALSVPASPASSPSVPVPPVATAQPVRRRATPSSRPRVHAPKSKAARSVAISIVINALENAGIDPQDAQVDKLVQDVQEDLE